MAIYRDPITGKIDRNEFENHLKATTRKEGYMEVIMFTPDPEAQVSDIQTDDVLSMCDITSLTDIEKYSSDTIATLEENLWLLNGRYSVWQGQTLNGYISNSVSDDNGEFETNPSMRLDFAHLYKLENLSIVLNSAVPSAYPKSITVKCYGASDNLLDTKTVAIESEEPTGEVDEDDQPIMRKVLLDSLPSVNFEINRPDADVHYITIEYNQTRFRHRRIRVSSILFGKTLVFEQDQIVKAEYKDKTSYVCDTLPSRVFKLTLNNYNGEYNVDNPNNGYISMDRQTIVRFRNGYNVWGYTYDDNGRVIMQNGRPVVDIEQEGVEIEWDDWKVLRLMDVSADPEETATFTCGSILDIMEDTYTDELYPGAARTVKQIADNVLNFMGLDLNTIEWSDDGIKIPTYDDNHVLLPYGQWETTPFDAYTINTPVPETSCKQVLQYLAFAIGATILLKDNGHIRFAHLDILNNTTFTNHYTWNYDDFMSIPAAEQLEYISKLSDLSMPKYYSNIDRSGSETLIVNGETITNLSVITTVTCNAMSVEATYGDCIPVGARMANDDQSGASIANIKLRTHSGIINLGGYVAGTEAKVEILGYPVKVKTVQERTVTNNSLILDTKVMQYDVTKYVPGGTPEYESEQIKRKYLEWYKRKFKYTMDTRGEPLVNAGDYATIQTQFSQNMPVYILQNNWTFDGAWEGDMEVIALD